LKRASHVRIPEMDTLEIQRTAGAKAKTSILQLKGTLTLATLFELQDALRQPDLADTILDLNEVAYIDSAGLGAILSHWAHTQRHSYKFAVVGTNDRVRTVFEMTKVDSVLPMFPNAEEAERAF
jgi:anti-anti-sigma factor